MEKVVWSGLYVVQKAESRSCRLERSWKCQECWRYPRPELNKHRSNSVSFHTLFSDASKTGARWLSDQKTPGHTLCVWSGY
jgi:hypothetical protein